LSFWQSIKAELGRETQPVDTVVRLIILERGVRGLLLLVVGLALLTDSRQILNLVRGWLFELNLNPGRGLIRNFLITILRPVGLLPQRTVQVIALATAAYAALELTEAIGLARRRRWAEYLTVLASCVGIPFEVREVILRLTPLRVSFLLINVAIVVYLAWQKRLFGLRGGERHESPTPTEVGESSA
jgi:uncharacterized membrane protein (DUF2068 family)